MAKANGRSDARARQRYRDYTAYGNLAYDFNALEREKRQPNIRTIKRPSVRVRAGERVSPFAIAGFAVVAVMLVAILMCHVQLTAITAASASLQSELSELQTQNVTLTTAYEQAFDLQTVESAAIAAGMSKPSAGQVYYIDLSEPDSAQVYQTREPNAVSRLMATVGAGLHSVIDYFQ